MVFPITVSCQGCGSARDRVACSDTDGRFRHGGEVSRPVRFYKRIWLLAKTNLNEDKIALLTGCFIFLLAALNLAHLDVLGWVVSTNMWTSMDKAFSATTGAYKGTISGVVSLLCTYVALTAILSFGIKLLGGNVARFVKSFTVVFFISEICYMFGANAHIAATPDAQAKFGIDWSIGLTTEAGFIVALVAGIFISNAFPRIAESLHDACRPELFVKIAIVVLGAELGVKAAAASGMAGTIIFRGLCAIVEAYLLYWAFVYYVARKYFKFSREWAVPLASGISICGVSAAIATGSSIRALAVVLIMVITHTDRGGVHLHRNADPALHRFPLPVQRAHGGRRLDGPRGEVRRRRHRFRRHRRLPDPRPCARTPRRPLGSRVGHHGHHDREDLHRRVHRRVVPGSRLGVDREVRYTRTAAVP